MLPLLQDFLRHRPTLRTSLRSSTRIHFDNLDTSTLGLVFEDLKELAPASVQHGTGKPAVPGHPFDVQAFHRDHPVPVNQLLGDLVVLIASVISNCSVRSCHGFSSFRPRCTALAFAAKRPLAYLSDIKTIIHQA